MMAYENYEHLLFEKKDNLGIITVNRPEVRNALNTKCWIELRTIFEEIKLDNEVRVVIITGAGGKAFVAGADIGMLQAKTPIEQLMATGTDTLNAIEWSPKVVIAAIDGVAFGGGCELAMAADIRVATKKSKFGQLEINLGIIPSAGGTQRLPRLIGLAKAKELIVTGDVIDAEEALRLGLVNHMVENSEDLLPFCKNLAARIINKSPIAVQLAKTSVNFGMNTDIYSGFHFERLAQGFAFTTEDKMEGTTAFLEKRPAVFKGK